jgi:hypothetical protein
MLDFYWTCWKLTNSIPYILNFKWSPNIKCTPIFGVQIKCSFFKHITCMWDLRFSCVDCGYWFLSCDIVRFGRSVLIFGSNLQSPPSGFFFYRKEESVGCFETLVMIYKTTWRHMPQDSNLHLSNIYWIVSKYSKQLSIY